MGLFSFLKNVGSKVLGASEAQAATADELAKVAQENGLDVSNASIAVEGDKVKITGTVNSQEEAEKIILSLGNTVGVAQVDTSQLIVNKPAPESKMYTVAKGDTLWKIAETVYGKGHGAKYTEIVTANTPPVKDPDLIQPGWVLRIPPLAA
jgi:nucleoid-associated protein YgaU